MSDSRHLPTLDDAGWPAMAVECLPGLVWGTDCALRITYCRGDGLSGGVRDWHRYCGQTLAELVGTEDPDNSLLAAHRQALAGRQVPFAAVLEGQAWCGQTGPARDANGIVGCVSVAVREPCPKFPGKRWPTR